MLDTGLRRHGHINRDFRVLLLITNPGFNKYWTCLFPVAPLGFSFLGFADH